jgi:hypothetical protein
LIWQNLIAENPDYANVRPTDESGDIALSSISNDQTTYGLFPAALGNATVRSADEFYGDNLALVGFTDCDFDDAQGKPLYGYSEIPSGTYKNSLQGWFSGKKTLTWLATIYINKDNLTDQTELKTFIRSVMKARTGIVATFGS